MKALIIGLGSIAQKHISALHSLYPNIEISALRHSKKSKEQERIKNIYSNEEAFKLKPDFILICNPSSKHYETINTFADLKKPLFIEKPALISTQNAKDLLKKIQSNNIHTYVACNLRFLDCLTHLKYYLKDKTVQETRSYCGSYLPNWRKGQDFRESYSSIPELGGGVHLDLIHELDYVYWLFGSPKKTTSFLRTKSHLEIKAVDTAHYVLEYSNFLATVSLNYFRQDYQRTFEVLLPDESLLVDLGKNSIINLTTGDSIFSSQQSLVDTYTSQMKSFVESITSLNSVNSLEQHLSVLEICLDE